MTSLLRSIFVGAVVLSAAAPAHAQSASELDATKVYLWSGGVSRCAGKVDSGAPSGGVTCDWYIDYVTGDLYTKHAGVWTKVPRLEDANTWTAAQTINGNLIVGGSGTVTVGGNTIINSSGKIPALTSTYLASLDLGALTGTLLSTVQDNITRTGALNSGSITSGFGSIDVGADAITGGAFTGTTGSFSSTLQALGNFNINTTKFTVAASTGNTVAAGTLDVAGDFKVNTNKFTVAASSGNIAIAGTADVTGAATFASNIGTSSYVSRTTGWRVTSGGEADFRNLFTDELTAKSFITDLEQALAGGQIITKSVAVVASAFSVPSPGAGISSITRSGSTATATTGSLHGFSNGDLAYITGADQTEYNGLFSVTVTDTTHFTYTVTGTPVTPATTSSAMLAQGAQLLVVEDLPSAPDMQVFQASDYVVLRSFSRANGGLIIGNAVGQVLAPDTSASGTQTWTFIRTTATPGSLLRGTSIAPKALVLDYGVSGNGFIESTTIDGTGLSISLTRSGSTATLTTSAAHGYQTGDVVYISGADQPEYDGTFTITVTSTTSFTYTVTGTPATPATGAVLINLTNGGNAPYTQIVTWASAPVGANMTLRTRLGNLRGVTGTLEYGLLAGTYGATNGSFFRASGSNFDLQGITAKWWAGSTEVIRISPNGASPFVSIGNPLPSACCTTAGLILTWDNGANKAKASFYSDANNFFTFDGTKLTWKAANTTLDSSGNLTATSATLSGALTATSGTIAGSFTIGTGGSLASGASAYGTGTGIWAAYNGGTPQFRVGNPSGNRFEWDGTNIGIVSGNILIDNSTGISLTPGSSGSYTSGNAFHWSATTADLGLFASQVTGNVSLSAVAKWTGAGVKQNNILLDVFGATLSLQSNSDGSSASASLSAATTSIGSVGGTATLAGLVKINTGHLEQTTSNYLYPGSASGLSDYQTSYYLASHSSWGLYTNAGMRFDGASAGLEVGSASSSNTPYVDFHSSNNSVDYDSRMIASGGTSTAGRGTLSWLAGDFAWTATGVAAMSLNSSGTLRVGVDGPTSLSGAYVGRFQNASSSGWGVQILAGNASTDFALYVLNYLGGGLMYVAGDGSVVVGAPTGGAKGAGTINAQAVYDDNTLLTDWLFDLYYDQRGARGPLTGQPETKPARDWKDSSAWDRTGPNPRRLYTTVEVATFTQQEHRLPWMPKASEFEVERSTGGMLTRLYQGQEQQQLYIFELETRIRALEQAAARAARGGRE